MVRLRSRTTCCLSLLSTASTSLKLTLLWIYLDMQPVWSAHRYQRTPNEHLPWKLQGQPPIYATLICDATWWYLRDLPSTFFTQGPHKSSTVLCVTAFQNNDAYAKAALRRNSRHTLRSEHKILCFSHFCGKVGWLDEDSQNQHVVHLGSALAITHRSLAWWFQFKPLPI